MPKNGRKKLSFVERVNSIGKRIAERTERRVDKAERVKPDAATDRRVRVRPLVRKATPEPSRVKQKPVIAYDLETTSIKSGTPIPLYLTACGDGGFWFSGEIVGKKHLGEMLAQRFLIPETVGARFVAWNGNNFDAYLILMALLLDPQFIVRPYTTRSKNLRGMKVFRRDDESQYWEFLDGIAMLGMVGTPLKKFLEVFAPDYGKLEGPDFEKENFNPRNAEHVKYAERDSEGLYHGLRKAREIVMQNFAIDLCPTIGNMGIKILQRFIPEGVQVWRPPLAALKPIRNQVMRGGFCSCPSRYKGPVWKYDINQAYAAAMRDAKLPAGRCFHSTEPSKYAQVYIARIRAHNYKNRIPFYYCEQSESGQGKAVQSLQDISETWLTSIEIEQLRTEGWRIEFLECWYWETHFNLRSYVDRLEWLRVGEGRDPKDAQGTMVKAIGNNSYGKTVERLDGIELVASAERPEGFSLYDMETEGADELIWFRLSEPMLRSYHQPQLGAFITAHVRMVVRRAALLNPDTWLYADTDCVMFRSDETARLDIDPKRYGAWKVEETGAEYILAAKKVYVSSDGKTKHAKGLNIRKLTVDDFEKWYRGEPPQQEQLQRQSFVKVIAGYDMFIHRTKVGEKIARVAAG